MESELEMASKAMEAAISEIKKAMADIKPLLRNSSALPMASMSEAARNAVKAGMECALAARELKRGSKRASSLAADLRSLSKTLSRA